MATTRSTAHALPGQPWGDFTGKASSEEPGPEPSGGITRPINLPRDRFFLPQLRSMAEVRSWAANLVRATSLALAQLARQTAVALPQDGSEPMGAPLPLHSVTVATLPAAADWEGAVVYVSDGAAGARFRGSNGSAWVDLG